MAGHSKWANIQHRKGAQDSGRGKAFNKLIDRIEKSSDKAEILKDTQKAHEIIVNEAPWAFIVHDRNPRAMTKKVKGFISAQSWFQDFTNVDME